MFFRVILLASLVFLSSAFAVARDRFHSFRELATVYAEGRDFEIFVKPAESSIVVIAIHGGSIEPGADLIAREIAGQDLALYLFVSKLPRQLSWDLHLTATRFDEPRAVRMVESSLSCLSIHGFWDIYRTEVQPPRILVGGRASRLRKNVEASIEIFRALFFPELRVESGTGPFAGLSPKNIVNRSRGNGVQLELSEETRDLFEKNPEIRSAFISFVREGLKSLQ